jgi:hypothetical protein
MSTGVLETCRELEQIYMKKKRIVRQVGYLQERFRMFAFFYLYTFMM